MELVNMQASQFIGTSNNGEAVYGGVSIAFNNPYLDNVNTYFMGQYIKDACTSKKMSVDIEEALKLAPYIMGNVVIGSLFMYADKSMEELDSFGGMLRYAGLEEAEADEKVSQLKEEYSNLSIQLEQSANASFFINWLKDNKDSLRNNVVLPIEYMIFIAPVDGEADNLLRLEDLDNIGSFEAPNNREFNVYCLVF